MSYILEALRKSHHDRERVADRLLQHSAAEARRSARRRQMVLWTGVGLLGINAALLAWLAGNQFLQQHDPSAPTAVVPAPPPPVQPVMAQTGPANRAASSTPLAAPTAPSDIPAAAPSATTIAVSPPPAESAAAPATPLLLNDATLAARDMALERQQDLARRRSSAVLGSEPRAETAAETAGKVTFGAGEAPLLQKNSDTGTPPGHAVVLNDANSAVVDAELGSIPLFMNMDDAFRSKWTGLSLDVHVFSPAAADRFVFINMEKYREGDRTKEGLLVNRIVADGVILEDAGQRFRLTPQ